MGLGQLGVGVGASDGAPIVDVEGKGEGTGGGVKARVVAPLVPHEAAHGHAVGVIAADELAAVVDADVAREPAGNGIERAVATLAVDEAAGGVGWPASVAPRPWFGIVAPHGAERLGGARPGAPAGAPMGPEAAVAVAAVRTVATAAPAARRSRRRVVRELAAMLVSSRCACGFPAVRTDGADGSVRSH